MRYIFRRSFALSLRHAGVLHSCKGKNLQLTINSTKIIDQIHTPSALTLGIWGVEHPLSIELEELRAPIDTAVPTFMAYTAGHPFGRISFHKALVAWQDCTASSKSSPQSEHVSAFSQGRNQVSISTSTVNDFKTPFTSSICAFLAQKWPNLVRNGAKFSPLLDFGGLEPQHSSRLGGKDKSPATNLGYELQSSSCNQSLIHWLNFKLWLEGCGRISSYCSPLLEDLIWRAETSFKQWSKWISHNFGNNIK